MSNITTKNKIGIKSGGLHARIAEGELLKEIAPSEADNISELPNRIALMIDLSGSMAGEPVKLLEQAIQDFIQKSNISDTAIAVESFPPGLRIDLTNDKMKLWMLCMGLSASGGTPMSEAMEYCLKNYTMTRAILISDGEPQYEPTSITELYKEKKIPVDTVHIGLNENGEACLKRISDITGGLYVKFKDIKSFANAFAFLLPETRSQAATLFLTSGANEVR